MMVLSETWIEDKGWNRWKQITKGIYMWVTGGNKKEQKREGDGDGDGDRKRNGGRRFGGGGKRDGGNGGEGDSGEREMEGGRGICEKEKHRGDVAGIRREDRGGGRSREDDYGRGFNARTGKKVGEIGEEMKKEKREEGGRSRDEKINREGRVIVNFLEERGCG